MILRHIIAMLLSSEMLLFIIEHSMGQQMLSGKLDPHDNSHVFFLCGKMRMLYVVISVYYSLYLITLNL